jgi:Ca2+-binding RTX toxin-like protein
MQATRGLFLQQADGTFRETASYGIAQPVLTGDFNNDGRDDAVSFQGINLAMPPAVFTTPRRTLVIDGTRRADVVSVAVSGSRIMITLNGETLSARLSRVRRIQITTGLGRDTVTIDPSVFSPALISSGGESDTVVGGSGNDTIQGDNGSDILTGGAGVDLIQGGKGLDTLDGGAGSDAVYGGREVDTFAAGDALSELLDRTSDEPIV